LYFLVFYSLHIICDKDNICLALLIKNTNFAA